MDICRVLVATISSDENERKTALEYLDSQSTTNYKSLIESLVDVFINASTPSNYRAMAGLYIKNLLTSRIASVKATMATRWLSLEHTTRMNIKTKVLNVLGTESMGNNSCAQLVAAIACVEFSDDGWDELILTLTGNIRNGANKRIQESSIECVGYICQDIPQTLLAPISGNLLNNIVFCMKKEESDRMRVVATKALYNSLECIKRNFNVEVQRNSIMQCVCESAVSPNTLLRIAGLQCLSQIVYLYYEFMGKYMTQALFGVVFEAMKSDDDEVVLQGIEFWSTLADVENEFSQDDSGGAVVQNYCTKALPYIVPCLLERLCVDSSQDGDDCWTPHKASAACLILLSGIAGNEITPYLLPFISENYGNSLPTRRDAAMVAMGSLIEGPTGEQLCKIVKDGFEIIIGLTKDPSDQVRDSATWALGRIYHKLPEYTQNADATVKSLTVVYEALSDVTKVATNACWTFIYHIQAMFKANQKPSGARPETLPISPQYENIINTVLSTIQRPDAASTQLRTAAFELLNTLVSLHAYDTRPTIARYFSLVLEECNKIFEPSHLPIGADLPYEVCEFQSLFCMAIQSFIKSMDVTEIQPVSVGLMTNLIRYIKNCHLSTVKEDLLITLSVLIQMTPQPTVLLQLPTIMPHIIECFQNVDDPTVVSASASLISDVAYVVRTYFVGYSERVISLILMQLSNPVLDPKLKSSLMMLLGDIAISLSAKFTPYLGPVLEAIKFTSIVSVSEDDDIDSIELAENIRTSCLECYTMLIQGLYAHDTPSTEDIIIWSPHISHILSLMDSIAKDCVHGDEMTRICCGLIGDMIQTFKDNVSSALASEFVQKLVTEAISSKQDKTRAVAVWLKRLIGSVN